MFNQAGVFPDQEYIDTQDRFVNIHDQHVQAEKARRDQVDQLGITLQREFDDAARRRQPFEDDWLEDLRQYKGKYDENTEKELKDSPNRSQAFMRLTKVKVDSMKARVMDLLFPASGERNWTLDCSPEPQVAEHILQDFVARAVQAGQAPEEINIEELKFNLAKEAVRRMALEIEDQLVEKPGRMSYRQVCDSVVGSAFTFGTGVLKGPLVEFGTSYRWMLNPDGSWGQASEMTRDLRPYKEFVSIWSCYPDMDATDIRQAQFVWQEHVMTKRDLEGLHSKPHFNMEAIREYLRDHPDGDAVVRNYETQLRSMSSDTAGTELKGRYRVLERWGYISGQKLFDAGYPVPKERLEFEVPVNLWLMGNKVIRLVPWPMPDLPIPYHFYYYHKDETSIFGEGVASVARHPQKVINASVRCMLDNASISSGPQIGVNKSALAGEDDPTDIYGWKVWLFENYEDMQKCMQVWDLPNYTDHFLKLIHFMTNIMDEVTTPRFMHGDGRVKGAGETASGLSMLMGAANISIKDLIKQFDDQITRPFISSMYHWNMRFSLREDIKGDFEVVARGSTSLMAREVQAEKLMNAMNIISGTRFEGWIKDNEALGELFQSMDISPKLVRSEDEYRAWLKQKMKDEALVKAQANLETLLNEVQSRGIDPNEALKHMLAEVMREQMQGGPGQPGQAQAQPPAQARGAPVPA